jgi:hypothetical protein
MLSAKHSMNSWQSRLRRWIRTSPARIVSRPAGCVAGFCGTIARPPLALQTGVGASLLRRAHLSAVGAWMTVAADDKHRYGIDRCLLRVSDGPAARVGSVGHNRSGSLVHHRFDYSDNRARSSRTFAISSCRRGSRASSVAAKSWIK